jgi:hypothetical protein
VKKCIVIPALLGLGFFFGPCGVEGTSNACAALEQRAATLATANDKDLSPLGRAFVGVIINASNGRFGEAMIRQKAPGVPPFLGCPLSYWNSIINPPTAEDIKRLTAKND